VSAACLARGVAALLLAFACGTAQAALACSEPDARGVRLCKAALPAALVQRMVQSQEQPKWCWAAALSMIFARHGHVLPQREIVREIYGAAFDTGIPTRQLPHAITRNWYAQGVGWRAAAKFQMAPAGSVVPVSSVLMATSLEQDEPLLLSANGHAVVVVELRWQEAAGGARRIVGGTVIDPLPNVGIRALAADELQVGLLARVDVRALPPQGFVSVAQLRLAGGEAEEVVPPQ
jgi:hypothetical protein